jgi:hypothetical protein
MKKAREKRWQEFNVNYLDNATQTNLKKNNRSDINQFAYIKQSTTIVFRGFFQT